MLCAIYDGERKACYNALLTSCSRVPYRLAQSVVLPGWHIELCYNSMARHGFHLCRLLTEKEAYGM